MPPVSVSQPQDIQPGPDGSEPLIEGAAELNGVLIFGADDGTYLPNHPEGHGGELWRSDGTPEGTYMLKDIFEGGYLSSANSSQPSEFTASGGKVFFDAFSPSDDGLWKTDGTAAGTVPVIDLNSALNELVDVDGTLYFLANSDGVNGFELWKSDGTTAGTEMVTDIKAFSPTVADREADDFIAAGGKLFFNFETASGRELWTSDGTEDGTMMVKDIAVGPGDGIAVNWRAIEFDDKLFFPATDGFDDRQLWSSDGTAAGTVPLADTSASPSISVCCGMNYAVRGDELFFEADTSLARYETGGSSGLVSGGNLANEPTNVGGTIYFYKSSPSSLWRLDDAGAAATKVADVDLPALLTEFAGGLYFQATDPAHGIELWRSDGTAAGTERLTDINPGAGDSLVNALVTAGDNLFFRGGDEGPTGVELWEAHGDGTPPDTSIATGPANGSTITTPTVTFTFVSDEAGSTFTCALDGASPEACNSGTKTYDDLAGGAHSFAVFATDNAGNPDLSPASRAFSVQAPPAETPTQPPTAPPTLDRAAPRLELAGPKKQKSKSKVVVKATCTDEACDLRATGSIKVKVLEGDTVKKTKTLKLERAKASAKAGESAKLKLKLNGRAKKLVKKVLKKKASKATVAVAATDAAGNSSSAERTIKVVKKRRGNG